MNKELYEEDFSCQLKLPNTCPSQLWNYSMTVQKKYIYINN